MTIRIPAALLVGAAVLAAGATAALAEDAAAPKPDTALIERACERMIAVSGRERSTDGSDLAACTGMMGQVYADCTNAGAVLECVAGIETPDALMVCAESCQETEGRKARAAAEAETQHHPGDGHDHGPAVDLASPAGRACSHAIELARKEGIGGDHPDDLAACVADLGRMQPLCAHVHEAMLACIEQADGSEAVFGCIDQCEQAATQPAPSRVPAQITPATADEACAHLAKLSRDEGETVVDEDLPKCRASVEKIGASCKNPEKVYGCFAAIESTDAFMDCAVVCEPKQP